MFNKIKDKSISLALEQAINYKLKDIGKLVALNLNSKDKVIELEVLLEDEKESLHVKINSYEIAKEDGEHFLVVKDVSTSRAWINKIALKYLKSRHIKIPKEYASIVKMLV